MRREMGDFKERLEQMRTHPGFIAALDQSGGSAPHALRAYGIQDHAWSNEEECLRSCICPDKAKAEDLLKAAIMEELDALPVGQLVMLKLTLPDKDELYASAIPRL